MTTTNFILSSNSYEIRREKSYPILFTARFGSGIFGSTDTGVIVLLLPRKTFNGTSGGMKDKRRPPWLYEVSFFIEF